MARIRMQNSICVIPNCSYVGWISIQEIKLLLGILIINPSKGWTTERLVAVLEIPLVNSGETAVRVQIVKDFKGKK